MASALFAHLIMNHLDNSVGVQLLDIVTSGMYSDPRMIFREYVQNAADSIEKAIKEKVIDSTSAKIDIDISPSSRTITIFDNGIGMTQQEANKLLGSLALSSKNSGDDRGFRGIGRLGGLGYCDQVILETKSADAENIVTVSWKATPFRGKSSNFISLDSILAECTKTNLTTVINNRHEHFFKVKLINVQRFGDDVLFDENNIYQYLTQVAPVPYDCELFSFSKIIENHINSIDGTQPFRLFLNKKEVKKNYSDRIHIRGEKYDQISNIHLFEFSDNKNEILAKGWYAQTNYLASLSNDSGVGGIRFRQGNIEVGDAFMLSPYLSEARFSAWHIGEIHFSYRLKLNARRDDFELSPEYERCTEQLSQLGRHLGYIIRAASKKRGKTTDNTLLINKARTFLENSSLFTKEGRADIARYLLARKELLVHSKESNSSKQIDSIRSLLEDLIQATPDLLDYIDGRKLRHKKPIDVLENSIRIIEGLDFPLEKKILLIKSIIEPYRR